MANPIGASRAAGDIAIQSLLFVLIEMTANGFDDPDEGRREIRKLAEEVADRSAVPDMSPEMKAQDHVVREQAKRLIQILTAGGVMPSTN